MVRIGFPGGSVVKNLPANAGETRDMGSGMKDTLEEEMASMAVTEPGAGKACRAVPQYTEQQMQIQEKIA